MENNDPAEEKNDKSDDVETAAEQIEKFGEVATPNAKHLIHCLNIIGQV